MLSYLSSIFTTPSTSASSPQPTTSDTAEESPSSSQQPDSVPPSSTSNPAHAERNRKKRLAKKKSKQRRRQSTISGNGNGSDEEEDDEEFPDADEDCSYIPLEADNTPSTTAPPQPKPKPSDVVSPSQIPPQEVMSAVSRLPPLLPNGEKLPNDERAKRIITSQGFVPVEDEDGGLHVGVKIREGVVAVMGKDGPLLFQL